MIQPKIQTTFIPVNPGDITKYPKCTLADIRGEDQFLSEQELITFTPEEFETFKREFGSKLLEKAADNAKTNYFDVIIRESITSVLDDYLKDNKI
jgi:hypothetical protein